MRFSLRRNIAEGKNYMPEIDGLRFLAIITVLAYHIILFVSIKFNISFTNYFFIPFLNGAQGVQVFFVISGFILTMPFAFKIPNGQKIDLKSYFYRRLTRLEPPYIISLLFFFCILIITKRNTFFELFDNLIASIFYIHNIVFGKGSDINTVAWSLEVEIQFYILVPLLALLFKFPKKTRRVIFITICIISLFLNFKFHFYFRTILAQAHYFILGMILADLYVSKDIPKLKSSFFGWLGLLIILFINRESSNLNELLFIFGCLILFLFVLANDYWKRIFATKSISLIGGMCYSIYLLHYPIISFFGTYFSTIYLPKNQFDFIFYFIVLVPVILAVSTVYYLLIEKPCMDSTWPTKLKVFLFKK